MIYLSLVLLAFLLALPWNSLKPPHDELCFFAHSFDFAEIHLYKENGLWGKTLKKAILRLLDIESLLRDRSKRLFKAFDDSEILKP